MTLTIGGRARGRDDEERGTPRVDSHGIGLQGCSNAQVAEPQRVAVVRQRFALHVSSGNRRVGCYQGMLLPGVALVSRETIIVLAVKPEQLAGMPS